MGMKDKSTSQNMERSLRFATIKVRQFPIADINCRGNLFSILNIYFFQVICEKCIITSFGIENIGQHQRKVLFKDSLNYFCELDALTKVFALPEEMATTKPYFPYLYVKRQHLHEQIRGVPPLDYTSLTIRRLKRERNLLNGINNK